MIELLLALGIGSFITLAIIQLFISSSRTYQTTIGYSNIQDTGRLGLSLLSESLQKTGFFGCHVTSNNILLGLNGLWTQIPEYNITIPIEAYHHTTGNNYTPPIASFPIEPFSSNTEIPGNGIEVQSIADNTDILVIRYLRPEYKLDASSVNVFTNPPPNTTPIVLSKLTPNVANLNPNDILYIGDCEYGMVVNASAISPLNATDYRVELLSNSAPNPQFANRPPIDFQLLNSSLFTSIVSHSFDAQTTVIGHIQTEYYFIAPSTIQQPEISSTNFSLWRKIGNAPPQELLENVSDLTIEFGIDNNISDKNPQVHQYTTYDNITNPNQIVTVRVSLEAVFPDIIQVSENTTVNRLFQKTILLRNITLEGL